MGRKLKKISVCLCSLLMACSMVACSGSNNSSSDGKTVTLAKELDVSVAFLSRIENGASHINLKRLSQVCDILGVTEGEILNGTANSSKRYLNSEFAEILDKCPADKQKLLYKIAKAIIEED